ERDANKKELSASFTQEEIEMIEKTTAFFDYATYGSLDMPAGTIITDAYDSDIIVPVISKSVADTYLAKPDEQP
ncbi:MAG: hypothetical protein IJT77_09230, partial [Clostridia bacterium]|nr:hypothetical protein [Clostridia bacterium]